MPTPAWFTCSKCYNFIVCGCDALAHGLGVNEVGQVEGVAVQCDGDDAEYEVSQAECAEDELEDVGFIFKLGKGSDAGAQGERLSKQEPVGHLQQEHAEALPPLRDLVKMLQKVAVGSTRALVTISPVARCESASASTKIKPRVKVINA